MPATPAGERPPLDPRIDAGALPRHTAVIMDGNGRWAKERGKAHVEGHEAGARSVRAIIEAGREIGLEAITLYAFSTENWKRSDFEVNSLFRLMSKYIHRELEEIHKNNIRVGFLGRWDGLPAKAADDLRACLERTKENDAMTVNVALNYGGRAEIVDAARKLAQDVRDGHIAPEDITEERFAQRLYLPEWAEVDLLIRTSGELRLSNFMLWELSYAEIVVQSVLWPDFRKEHLCDAIVEYQQRSRRYGGRP
ncbi:MAG: di-trans,poly-cis-decaprenylcistransferase [Candidatus Hydrogenedens sp.]|nr:di-trans,poly-cis-decaprenylcistransferase [Candidatus Hydrogenedens sp.]